MNSLLKEIHKASTLATPRLLCRPAASESLSNRESRASPQQCYSRGLWRSGLFPEALSCLLSYHLVQGNCCHDLKYDLVTRYSPSESLDQRPSIHPLSPVRSFHTSVFVESPGGTNPLRHEQAGEGSRRLAWASGSWWCPNVQVGEKSRQPSI